MPAACSGIDVHPSGRIASSGRDRRVKVWEPDGKLVARPRARPRPGHPRGLDRRRPIAGLGRLLGRGPDLEPGAIVLDFTCRCPPPAKPPRLALVVPDMTPARPYISKPAAAADPSPGVIWPRP